MTAKTHPSNKPSNKSSNKPPTGPPGMPPPTPEHPVRPSRADRRRKKAVVAPTPRGRDVWTRQTSTSKGFNPGFKRR